MSTPLFDAHLHAAAHGPLQAFDEMRGSDVVDVEEQLFARFGDRVPHEAIAAFG
jgi:hypothetical protein